jgi:hypothetical protein
MTDLMRRAHAWMCAQSRLQIMILIAVLGWSSAAIYAPRPLSLFALGFAGLLAWTWHREGA